MVSADAVPALDAIDPEVCYLGWDVVRTTDRPRQATDTVFLGDDMELSIEPVGDPGRGGRDHDRVGRCASRFAPQTDRSLEHPAQSNANYNYSNNIRVRVLFWMARQISAPDQRVIGLSSRNPDRVAPCGLPTCDRDATGSKP
jgi:hypothetical protein